ncbi:U-box domain-containing protein 52-like isoform X1 [Dendrobium catenatum]|uniref:U-box domain-containing protein 52-like isoform X1 n=1 Tax=Dendrobium catenatum TaxID=906689 RepID=UPI0009F64CD4|nr:U-box domain-containing protein 52-like isoform X1 [Dendrobium catenatum]
MPLENMLDLQRVKAPCESNEAGTSLVAVAIDKGKSSQSALKWALDNLVHRGQTITLLHVNTKGNGAATAQAMEVFIPFRCFCTRKDVKCKDAILEGTDIAKAIVEFLLQAASIDKLVIGSQSKGAFVRLKSSCDVPSSISKSAPDFCSVYIISKGKVTSVRNAVRPSPPVSSLRGQILTQPSIKLQVVERPPRDLISEEREIIRSPFTRYGPNQRSRMEISVPEFDISFVSSEKSFPSSGRPSFDRSPLQPRASNASSSLESSLGFMGTPNRSEKLCEYFSNSYSQENLQNMEDVEAEMKRLRLELKHTMDMYSNACREAISAKQKAMELHRWKMEEENRLEKARLAEETALAMVEREKAKAKAAIEAAEASKRIAELEAKKRLDAEMKAVKEAEEKNKALNALHNDILRYRKYSIEEIELATDCFAESQKIGGGSYGPVYFGQLDHTPVAIKVLRPDASQSRLQFHKEVEILSRIRHPNMVLLLGACPEYGCLVYEYMANGSLDDRLFRRGNTPPIPWQHRFRIAAEIGTGLLFLHQAKPEPLVHRELKPANILLDHNYVSKISDVGLARLLPPAVAENVTQYRMTSVAGTFCYIDPEYQQTGILGIKSDVYSLGIVLLQLITGKPPMGITYHMQRAIDNGMLKDILDPTVMDWPMEDAKNLAHIALKCAELRRKDRPDLSKVVLPELNRLRKLGESNMQNCTMGNGLHSSPAQSQISIQDFLSGPLNGQSGYESSRSRSSV